MAFLKFLSFKSSKMFSTKKMLPKRILISNHSKRVRRDRLLKAIQYKENEPPFKKSRHIEELEKIVYSLQPSAFMAALNPCPVLNEKFGRFRKNRSIKKLPVPIETGNRPQTWVHSFSNKLTKTGIIELDPDVFSQKLRKDILHRVVTYQQARKRAGKAKEKNRSEVRGGGRKPWPQKRTGRARHGSIRSPIFKGGGKVFPKTPRDFSFGLQKKVRRLGLKIALSQKFRENNLLIIDALPSDPKQTFGTLADNSMRQVLIAISSAELNSNPFLREQLINHPEFPDVHCIPAPRVNVYALLRLEHAVFTEKALEELTEKYSKTRAIGRHNREVEENIARMNRIPDAHFE